MLASDEMIVDIMTHLGESSLFKCAESCACRWWIGNRAMHFAERPHRCGHLLSRDTARTGLSECAAAVPEGSLMSA